MKGLWLSASHPCPLNPIPTSTPCAWPSPLPLPTLFLLLGMPFPPFSEGSCFSYQAQLPVTVPPSFQNFLSLLFCMLGPITLPLPSPATPPGTPTDPCTTSLFFTRLTRAQPHQEAWLSWPLSSQIICLFCLHTVCRPS